MPRVELNFDDVLRGLLEKAAATGGVSVDAYVREAVLMRLMLSMQQRRDPSLPSVMDHLRQTAVEPTARSGVDPSVAAVIEDPERLRALEDTGLLDSPPEEKFDRIVRLAAEALGAPVAAVSLVDDHRQFFKSTVGLSGAVASERETPLSHSLCQYAVGTGKPFIIENALDDPGLSENLAVQELDVGSYVGIPLLDDQGHALGTLCVWDSKPREWTRGHVQILEDLARMVTQRIPGG